MAIVLIGLSTGVAAWRYCIIFENLQPDRQAQTELGKHVIEPKGDVDNQAVEDQVIREEYAGAELKLGMISMGNQQLSDAINHYRRVLELDTNGQPDSVLALNNLAWLLATAPDPKLRNGKEAVRMAEWACKLNQYKEAYLIDTLAAAYAEAGRFDDAVATAQKARRVALGTRTK